MDAVARKHYDIDCPRFVVTMRREKYLGVPMIHKDLPLGRRGVDAPFFVITITVPFYLSSSSYAVSSLVLYNVSSLYFVSNILSLSRGASVLLFALYS